MPIPFDSEERLIRRNFEASINKEHPDFTIELQSLKWRVHAHVFADKSGFFRKMISGGNTWKESGERIVTLHDDIPELWARVLQFVYYGRYHQEYDTGVDVDMEEEEGHSVDELLRAGTNNYYEYDETSCWVEIDLGVYGLADKYDIPTLKQYSLESCVESFSHDRKNCQPDSPKFIDLFGECYPARMNQDQNLKNVIATCIASVFDELRADTSEWTTGAGQWLREDFELCTMVMDKLRHPKENFKCKP